ncbi:MAG: hypothetical protein MJ101_00495 [Clostridia bacterium]|nr:hypothetical protein [Clostridia bacterium]
MKKTNKPVELTDKQAEKVSGGGMKIFLWDKPKFVSSSFRLTNKTVNQSADNADASTGLSDQSATDDNKNAE